MILVITGGTGSLGSSIIQQQDILKKNGITKIRIISRDEQKQVSIQRNYQGSLQLDCYLGDVSDHKRMLFALCDADFVIHAAAQKHIDKFELDVPTGYKTNILGAFNVADAFYNSKNAKSGIFISTDKAASPITSYGVSKLASEHIWLWHNSFQKKISYGVGRWGNIFGSRGSIIEYWTELAIEKKPFEITDPSCTRFFMLIDDAARFSLSILFKNEKKIKIPEMKSIEMVKVAEMIWRYHNGNEKFQTKEIGLRGNEKLHEVLRSEGPSSHESARLTEAELKEMYEVWLSKFNPKLLSTGGYISKQLQAVRKKSKNAELRL